MGNSKSGHKKSLAQMTLVYLVIAAVVIAAVIMGVYTAIYTKAVENESPVMLDSFEDTYKFMMDKEEETADDVDRDMNVSQQLVSSARKISGDDFRGASSAEEKTDGDKEKEGKEEKLTHQSPPSRIR